MILQNKRDREAWFREKTIASLKANEFLELEDIILVAETGNFYKVVSEVTDIPLKKELYAKVIPSELIGNIETASKLKNPVNINLIGNVSGVTSFDGSEDVDINVKVKQLETPRVIGLEGNVTGSATFDGTKDVSIDIKVKQLETARTISLSGEVIGSAEFDGSTNIDINATVNKIHIPRTIELTGDTIGEVQFDGSKNVQINTTTKNDSHNHTNSTILSVDASKINTGILSIERIPNLDASKITSGIIDIERLPPAALERLVEVENDVERFALTKSQIQLGDVVKVKNTLKMYKVINDNKLNSEDGYSVFVAGRAAEVPWSGVTGKPNNYPPSSHTHTKGQITDFPTSLKNPTAITIQANGTSLGSYDGSVAKTFNITASNVGASASNHTHTAGAVGAYTKAEVDNKLSGKANSSHGNHVPATQSANNKVYLRNDNTWHTITPSDIGAQPAGSYATASHTHDDRYYTESEINTKLNEKANSSHTHPATQVTQDATHRFVTDTEKTTWNNKANAHSHPYLNTSGGTVTGTINLGGAGNNNGIRGGNKDGANLTTTDSDDGANLVIQSWYGVSFKSTCQPSGATVAIDVRSGDIKARGNITGAKTYNAVWNDYAELFERGEQTEAGDIIALDTLSPTEQYIKADSSSKRVIGVHSDTYGHLIGGEKLNNYEDNFEKFIPIGLAGRVNVKVKGKVELGDYIVPSEEKGIGRAYNKDIDDRDLIIGYLVETDNREDVRRLKMFINKK